MNKTLIKLFVIVGFFSAMIGLVLSFLPISNLAIFPAIFGFVLSIVAYMSLKKKKLSFSFPKIVMALSVLVLLISVGKNFLIENEVEEDTAFVEEAVRSEKEAVKELEALEELDEELEEELDAPKEIIEKVEKTKKVVKAAVINGIEGIEEVEEEMEDIEDLEGDLEEL